MFTKTKPISGGGIATYVGTYKLPFVAVQKTTWQPPKAPMNQISFVLSPHIPSRQTSGYWMSARTLTAVYQQSGEWWAAWIDELPGANTQGRTIEEARENLREAVQLILEEGEVPEESHEPLAPGAIREPLTVMA